MKEFDFNPFGADSLTIKFQCPDCNKPLVSESLHVPDPNFTAENARDSQVGNFGFAYCGNCDKEFDIQIFVTYAGASGSISNLDRNADIDLEVDTFIDEEEFDWLYGNETFYARFKDEIEAIRKLNEVDYEDHTIKRSIKRQLYIALITALEAYLADAFIYHLFHNDGYIKDFVEGFIPFNKQTINLSQLFEYQQKINTICKDQLKDILWHDIPKVSSIYKMTFDIDFGDISSLCKHVKNRHDLVHRAGATKDGESITIKAEDITGLSDEIEELVDHIDNELNNLESIDLNEIEF